MRDDVERALAADICGCANEQQRRRDIKLIRAYGDQRAREALDEAWKIADDDRAENENDDSFGNSLDSRVRAETADHIADKIAALKESRNV